MKKWIRIACLFLSILWMITIFLFSAQPAVESSQNSSWVVNLLVDWFVPDFADRSPSEQTALIDGLTVIVRKGAHMTEYAILAILLYLTASAWRIPFTAWLRYVLAWFGSVLYASTDELHQRFISGRSGELRDVLIDGLGALIGIMLVLLTTWIIRTRKQRNAPKTPPN